MCIHCQYTECTQVLACPVAKAPLSSRSLWYWGDENRRVVSGKSPESQKTPKGVFCFGQLNLAYTHFS